MAKRKGHESDWKFYFRRFKKTYLGASLEERAQWLYEMERTNESN